MRRTLYGGEKRPEQQAEHRESTARMQLETEAARRRDMRDRCREYDPTPIWAMTPMEAKVFAARQAEDAAKSISMTADEILLYASEVYQSIMKMNRADKRWQDHMRYLRECQKTQAESAAKRIGAQKERNPKIIIF